VTALIEAEEIVVATVDGVLAGAVRVQSLDAATGEFGLLAADRTLLAVGVPAAG